MCAVVAKGEAKTLPYRLPKGNTLVIAGINPWPVAARTGLYYSGCGNRFWPLLNDSGLGLLTPHPPR